MKKQRLIFTLISILALIVISSMALASCSETHKCSFTSTWSYNSTNHWHACSDKSCEKTSSYGAHVLTDTFDANGAPISLCSTCGYSEPRISTEVASAEEWNAMFDSFPPANFTEKAFATNFDHSTQQNVMLEQTTIITENSRYYSSVGAENEMYVTKNTDESYTLYLKGDELPSDCDKTKFYHIADNEYAQYMYEMSATSGAMVVTFENCFDSFTYDSEKKAYVCASTIEATAHFGEMARAIYCSSIEVFVSSDAVTAINCNYTFDLEDKSYYAISIYDIGTSKVEVPQSIVNGAETLYP